MRPKCARLVSAFDADVDRGKWDVAPGALDRMRAGKPRRASQGDERVGRADTLLEGLAASPYFSARDCPTGRKIVRAAGFNPPTRAEVIMRAIHVLLTATLGLLTGHTAAKAEITYPWCAQYGSLGGRNCGFSTVEQCQAAVSGNGGFCEANAAYRPALEVPH